MRKKIPLYTLLTIIIFLVTIFLWIVYLLILPNSIQDISDRGLFGDSFGALNTLFTGLAFAGVIISLIMQRRELELQRKELELTRKELSASAESQKKISDSSKIQAIILAKTAKLNAQTALLNYFEKNPSRLNQNIYDRCQNIVDSINAIKKDLDELTDNDNP